MTAPDSEKAAQQFVAERCEKADFARLSQLVSLLEVANQSQNLVARSSMSSVWVRHIADSAQLLDHVPRETSSWIDLGSGAGFPGLVLAIMDPSRTFQLVESRNLRVRWLMEAVESLRIENCEILGMDVRKVAGLHAGVISARAFAPLDRLIALSARFSTAATHWVLPKGRSASQEVAALPSAQRSMFHVKQSVTDPEAGIVVGTGKVETAA